MECGGLIDFGGDGEKELRRQLNTGDSKLHVTKLIHGNKGVK